jgi:DNA (cytosine-5)-methyltransferase 1
MFGGGPDIVGVLTGIDVCAGSGIGSLAFERVGLCRTVCFVEHDPYCQQVIQQRIRDGLLADAACWDDLRTFSGTEWRGVDLVFGGIPCQPWSVAGKQQGTDDARDLWPDFLRVVREVEPRYCLVENVPGLIQPRGGLRRILGDLASSGYDAVWEVLSAADAGAPHLRKRLWVLAYAAGGE